MAAGSGGGGVDRAALDPVKAYRGAWMMGPGAKPVRVLAEMMEPEERLRREHVNNTILFFGSARSKSREEWEAGMADLEAKKSSGSLSEEELRDVEDRIRHMKKLEWMCEYYDKVRDLSKRLTEWSMARLDEEGFEKYIVSTGGGPGMMEAANRGAFEAGGRSVGIGISLPFENKLNEYITPELAFSLHYFFTRKFWLLNPSVAMVVCPGGLGTLDEMFEATTLLQTRKMGGTEREYLQEMPIVLLGEEYWRKFINVQHGVDSGTCSPMDTERLYFTSSVDDAFDYITTHLEKMESRRVHSEAAQALTPEEKQQLRLAHLSKEHKAGLTSAKLAAPIKVTPEDAKMGYEVREHLLTHDSKYDVMAEEMDRSDA